MQAPTEHVGSVSDSVAIEPQPRISPFTGAPIVRRGTLAISDDPKPSALSVPRVPKPQGGVTISEGAIIPSETESQGISLKAYVIKKKESFKSFAKGAKIHGRSSSEPSNQLQFTHLPNNPSEAAPSGTYLVHRKPASPEMNKLPAASAPLSIGGARTIVDEGTPATPVGTDGILPLPEGSSDEHYELVEEIKIPSLLLHGVPMMKMSKKTGPKRRTFRLDPEQGQITWESKKGGCISIENIREIRTRANARNYRESFRIAADVEPRWLTIIYTNGPEYKTLHVVALSEHVFHMWTTALQTLYTLRRELALEGVPAGRRELIWEKQYWKSADSSQDAKLNFDEIQKLCARLNIYPASADLHKKFTDSDSNHDGFLSFEDFQKFVKLLKARPDVDRLFQEYAPDGSMEAVEFENFILQTQKSSLSKETIRSLFEKYTELGRQTSDPPTTEDLARAAQQLDIGTDPKLATLDSRTNGQFPLPKDSAPQTSSSQPKNESRPQGLSLEGFSAFLLSVDNAPSSEQQGLISQDMTRPICEYFINSSHNTYLVGNQLIGDSTTEGYIRALLQGCRSVELDIWDGDTEPCVYHGKTLTTKLSVRDVCRAIAKYAFVASPYPLIISGEIHCSIPQQDLVARIMKEEFGDTLVVGPLSGREHEAEKGVAELPSPEELKGRIMLKTKKVVIPDNNLIEAEAAAMDEEDSATSPDTSADDLDGGNGRLGGPGGAMSRARGLLSTVAKDASELIGSAGRRSLSATRIEPAKPKISNELMKLLVYTVGVKCRGLNKKEVYEPVHLFSLSEGKATKMMKQGMMDLIKHTRTHLIRIYPSGTRMTSSNYEPHKFWAAGAQLAAINMQTTDSGSAINYAMFQRNGGCGLVLKPDPIRIRDKPSLLTRTKHWLDVTIVSAQQLPRPKDSRGREIGDKYILSPFVEVTLHIPDWSNSPFLPENEMNKIAYSPPTNSSKQSPSGTSTAASGRTLSAKTKVVKDNGFNPVWDDEISLPFDLIGGMKELVFVRIEVREKGEGEDHPVGIYCVSLGSLQMGYRHLPLHDQQMSQYLFSTVFVKLDIRDV